MRPGGQDFISLSRIGNRNRLATTRSGTETIVDSEMGMSAQTSSSQEADNFYATGHLAKLDKLHANGLTVASNAITVTKDVITDADQMTTGDAESGMHAGSKGVIHQNEL